MLEAFLQHMHHMGLAPVDSHATISGLTIDHFLDCCSSKIVPKKRCGSSGPLCFLMDDDHDDTSSEFLLLPFPFATSLEATRENDNGRRQQTSCKPCIESSPNQFFLWWFSIAGEEKWNLPALQNPNSGSSRRNPSRTRRFLFHWEERESFTFSPLKSTSEFSCGFVPGKEELPPAITHFHVLGFEPPATASQGVFHLAFHREYLIGRNTLLSLQLRVGVHAPGGMRVFPLYLSLPCVGRLRTCAWMLLTMSSLLYRHSEKPNLPFDDAFSSGSECCCCCWRCSTEHLSRSIRFLSLLVKMERYKFPAAHKKVFRALFSLFKRERKTRESKKLWRSTLKLPMLNPWSSSCGSLFKSSKPR